MSIFTEFNKDEIVTVVGIFSDNIIRTADGDRIPCITYGSLRNEITEKYAFLNMYYSYDIERWVVFQYVFI